VLDQHSRLGLIEAGHLRPAVIVTVVDELDLELVRRVVGAEHGVDAATHVL